MKKTTPALIATTLITSFLMISMLMIGQDAISTPHSSTSANASNSSGLVTSLSHGSEQNQRVSFEASNQ